METNIEQLQSLVDGGHKIRWVGYHSQSKVHVHTTFQNKVYRYVLELQKDYTEDDFKRVYTVSADEPGEVTGTIWNSNSRLELLRLASILGINVGGLCRPGIGAESSVELGCIMAYDIECDRSRIPQSSFGSPSESIISIAVYCTCGFKKAFSFIRPIQTDYEMCCSSRDTVMRFISCVEEHLPQWIIGYNNFGYDNTRIAFHSGDSIDNILIPMKVGSGSSLTYAFYIDIEGIYNIDLMTYLDKTRRSMYPNMSLSSLISFHGIGEKMDFDTSDVRDTKKLLEYNIHDCKITADLAVHTKAIQEIVSLGLTACVPVIDAVRFVTGTFAACSIASYCLKNRICMDWSTCSQFQDYKGAHVLSPKVGLHEDVVSCDFSSMYPTILMAANISPENYEYRSTSLPEGTILDTEDGVGFVIGGSLVTFYQGTECIVPPVVGVCVDKRRAIKKSDPIKAGSLKYVANSIYGSLGDVNSRIYSPMCSAAITAGGRWCLAVAESVLNACGFEVVYGDTDSCYVKRTPRAVFTIEDVVYIMKHIFEFTPFSGMSMEVEDKFTKIVFLGKKTYFGMSVTGHVVSKGMSKSRKDRLGVCRSLSSNIVSIILSKRSRETTITIVADMISYVIDRCVQMALTLSDVSKQVKRGGSNYFEFKSIDGTNGTLECEMYSGNESVQYSTKFVCESMVREVQSILAVSGVGDIKSIMRYASII